MAAPSAKHQRTGPKTASKGGCPITKIACVLKYNEVQFETTTVGIYDNKFAPGSLQVRVSQTHTTLYCPDLFPSRRMHVHTPVFGVPAVVPLCACVTPLCLCVRPSFRCNGASEARWRFVEHIFMSVCAHNSRVFLYALCMKRARCHQR